MKVNKEAIKNIMYIILNLLPMILFIAGGIFIIKALFELGTFYGYFGIGSLFIVLAYYMDNFIGEEGETE